MSSTVTTTTTSADQITEMKDPRDASASLKSKSTHRKITVRMTDMNLPSM